MYLSFTSARSTPLRYIQRTPSFFRKKRLSAFVLCTYSQRSTALPPTSRKIVRSFFQCAGTNTQTRRKKL
jgi:hypothetical protein